jgi:hypothetical protein
MGWLASRGIIPFSLFLSKGGWVSPASLLFSALAGLPFQLPRITSGEIEIAIAALVGLVLLLALVARLRRGARFKGYENIAEQLLEIRKPLNGRIYRQEGDLMMEGKYHGWPVFVRLSHSQYTPGLYVQIPVPSRLALFFVPKRMKDQHQAGKVILQTPDEHFDARIVTRSDQPVQARMLLASERAVQQIQRLCAGSNTLVSVSAGLVEANESVIPEHDLGDHVMNHIRSMAKLGAEVAKLPGAEGQPVQTKAKSSSFVRIVVASGAALLVVLFFVNRAMQSSSSSGTRAVPAGVLSSDASTIPDLDRWRLAETSDFDSRGVMWVQNKGKQASGHLLGRFAGEGYPEESAYVMVSDDGRQPAQIRIVLIVNRIVRLDKTYPAIAIMTTVPRSNLAAIPWQGAPPMTPPDGDGLMIVSNYDDPASASIVYLCKKTVLTAGVPAHFQEISVQQ